MQKTFFKSVILILIALIGYSLFGNIGYPIIWGDEADTVMYAERILDYGYPKVHDGQNSLNYNMISGGVGVNEKYDAWTVTMWGQYYFTAIGTYVARFFDDIYVKTAILRIPQSIVGLMGTIMFGFVITPFLKQDKHKYIFWLVYLTLTLFSISLILHLREVRSYSLYIFLSSLFLILFVRYYLIKNTRYIKYFAFGTAILFLLVNIFPPGYLALSAGVGIYVFLDKVFRKEINNLVKSTIKDAAPIIVSGLLILPILVTFGTSSVSGSAYSDMAFSFKIYLSYIERIINFLINYHFLAVFIAFCLYFVIIIKTLYGLPIKDTVIKLWSYQILRFLIIFSLIYTPFISVTPYMFDRYFLFLQPIVSALIAYVFVLILNEIKKIKDSNSRSNYLLIFIQFSVLLTGIVMLLRSSLITGRIYELTHKYYGSMDYIVSYIKSNYTKPENLVIDTNIEQPVLMYYLGSQVICDDSPKCYSDPADIIIRRRGFPNELFEERIERYFEQADYQEVRLPIIDYPANNIPEFSLGLRHLFRTPVTENDSEKVILYVKKEVEK